MPIAIKLYWKTFFKLSHRSQQATQKRENIHSLIWSTMSFLSKKVTWKFRYLNFCFLAFFRLRYTIWIPLYPAGFICEGVIFLRNIPYYEETKKFTIELPNNFNFSFHFPTLLRFYLVKSCRVLKLNTILHLVFQTGFFS